MKVCFSFMESHLSINLGNIVHHFTGREILYFMWFFLSFYLVHFLLGALEFHTVDCHVFYNVNPGCDKSYVKQGNKYWP